MEVKMMMNAYGMLYQIENDLRSFIKSNMKRNYGVGWYICAPKKMKYPPYRKNFHSLNLHELISMVSSYECLRSAFEKSKIPQLQAIIPIRNKIAHSHKITPSENEHLYFIYNVVLQVTNRNNLF